MRARLQLVFALLLVACEHSAFESTSSQSAELFDDISTISMWGNDRIGDILRASPERAPSNLAEFERLFEVGRQCGADGSKEIFLIEEARTRNFVAARNLEPGDITPRLIMTGCNSSPHTTSGVRRSISLMAIAIGTPRSSHRAQSIDAWAPFANVPIEAIAIDRTTGRYNFYIFKSSAKERGIVTRIVPSRATSGEIDGAVSLSNIAGREEPGRLVLKNRACFNCHINGAPIMNELTDPWDNWVSSNTSDVATARAVETTLNLAVNSTSAGRGAQRISLAGELEQTIRHALRTWASGFAAETSRAPVGVGPLFQSVFCETQLNFESPSAGIPFELVGDPDALAGFAFAQADAPLGIPLAFKTPIRSEQDRAVDRWLQLHGYLDRGTALAIRLIDDDIDVFSSARCSLFGELEARLKPPVRDPLRVAEIVRRYLKEKLAMGRFGDAHAARGAFIAALLESNGDILSERVAEAQAAYSREFEVRHTEKLAQFTDRAGLAELHKRLAQRFEKAQAMFPKEGPLPDLRHAD